MYLINACLAVFVCVVVPLVAWKNKRSAVVLLAASLLVLNLDVMMIAMDSAARGVVDLTIRSPGGVPD